MRFEGITRGVHIMHNSESPASVFALLESPGKSTMAMVADPLFDLLMLKMVNFYQKKQNNKMEARGPRFEAGDFLVKLGLVTLATTFKGVLVEVTFSYLSQRHKSTIRSVNEIVLC